MSDSIRDDIEAAMKGAAEEKRDNLDDVIDEALNDEESDNTADDAGDEPSAEEPAGEPAKSDVSTEAKADEPAGEREAGQDNEGTWNPEKAPTSWSPKVREKWATLPEDVRKEIVRREEASVNGVRKLQEEFQPVRQFAEQLSPFIQEARHLGADPTQYIANVMVGERQLRSQDPNEKFNALLNIADTYGIPLRQYLGGEQAPAQSAPAVPAAVQQELAAMRQWREQEQAQQLQQQIDEFSKSAEFFNDVRNDMAVLIESGAAKDLKDAYEKAIWTNPEVREVMLARQEAEKQKTARNQRRSNAAAAAVPGSNDPGVTVTTDDEDDSIAGLVKQQFAAAQSGRI